MKGLYESNDRVFQRLGKMNKKSTLTETSHATCSARETLEDIMLNICHIFLLKRLN